MKPGSEGEIATVIKVVNDTVVVTLDNNIRMKEICDTCSARIICLPEVKRKRVIKLKNHCQLKVGDKVFISERENFQFKLSLFQYLIPLCGFVSGIIIINVVHLNFIFLAREFIIFLGGISGLFISGMIARYLINRLLKMKKNDAIFMITKVLP
jgi:positive regulator of sigma E activity